MPGGDLATYYPVRMLLSVLSNSLGLEKALSYIHENGISKHFRDDKDIEATVYQIKRGTLYTSSTGRILDSVSVLLDVCGYRSYEGEPAMKLEAVGHQGNLIEDTECKISNANGMKILLASKLIYELLEYVATKREDVAYTVQYNIGYGLGSIAAEAADKAGYRYIYVTGGAAVNDIIALGIKEVLKEYNLSLRMHRYTPPGDGCIALGQIYSRIYHQA
jgi:hydrogenase maturation protein HypF